MADEEHLLRSGVIDKIRANCVRPSGDLAIGWPLQRQHVVIEFVAAVAVAAGGTIAVSAHRIRGAFYSILCAPSPDRSSAGDSSSPIRDVDAIVSSGNFARNHDSSAFDVSSSIW